LPEDLELIAQYQPPIVVTALGSPKPAIPIVQAYGGLVFADVTSIALARKAVAAGADGLACISSGAGGHTGSISPFACISAVREFYDGHIIVGGGISDGWGVAGAVAAGADFVYMGTRFIPTVESMAPDAYKQMLVDSNVEDIIVSAGITGTPASWLKPSLRANGLDPDNMPSAPGRNYDSNQAIGAKKWKDVWAAGQGVGAVKQIEPVADVVLRLRAEYQSACRRMATLAQQTEKVKEISLAA
jgi:nitronate monooxygenase